MTDLGISELAQRQARWLMARQSAISDNIAHASAPGYRAVDVRAFGDVLEKTSLQLSVTSSDHFQLSADDIRPVGRRYAKVNDVSHSGNTVSLDQQLIAATEVRQGYALNTSVVKSLHRLVLSAVKA